MKQGFIITISLIALFLVPLASSFEDFDLVRKTPFTYSGASVYTKTAYNNFHFTGNLSVNGSICVWNSTAGAWACVTNGWNVTGGGGPTYYADEVYLHKNASNYFVFNETYLNLTVGYLLTPQAFFNETDGVYLFNSSPYKIELNLTALNNSLYVQWVNSTSGAEAYNGTFNATEQYFVYNDTAFEVKFNSSLLNFTVDQRTEANITSLWTNASLQEQEIQTNKADIASNTGNVTALWSNASAQQDQINALGSGAVFFNETSTPWVYNTTATNVSFNETHFNYSTGKILGYNKFLYANGSQPLTANWVTPYNVTLESANGTFNASAFLARSGVVLGGVMLSKWNWLNTSAMLYASTANLGVNASWFNASSNVTTPKVYGSSQNGLLYLYASSLGSYGSYLRLNYDAGFYLYSGRDLAGAGSAGLIIAGTADDNLNGGDLHLNAGSGGDDNVGAGNGGDGGNYYSNAGNGGTDNMGVNANGGRGGNWNGNAGAGGHTNTAGFNGGDGGDVTLYAGAGGTDIGGSGVGGNGGTFSFSSGAGGGGGSNGNDGEVYGYVGGSNQFFHGWGGATGIGIVNLDLQSRARAYLDNPQTIMCGAATQILFDALNYDNQNELGGAVMERFTAKKAGVYASVCGYWVNVEESHLSKGDTIFIYLYKNGAPYTAQVEVVDAEERQYLSIDVSDNIDLGAGENIECWVDCNTASGMITLNTGTEYTYMAVHKVS